MRLAVGVLTRNHESYIGTAVRSVADQTVPPSAIFILDNGSEDSTLAEIHKSVQEGFSVEPLVISLKENSNASGGLRRLLAAARRYECDFMVILHGDDWLADDYVSAVLNELGQEPPDIVLHGDVAPFGISPGRGSRLPLAWSGNVQIDRLLVRLGNPGSTPGSVLPVVHALEEGRLGEPFDTCCTEDWILWQRLVESGIRFRYAKDAVVHYRRHASDSRSDPRVSHALGLARGLSVIEATTRPQRMLAVLGASLDIAQDSGSYCEGLVSAGMTSARAADMDRRRTSRRLRALAHAVYLMARAVGAAVRFMLKERC